MFTKQQPTLPRRAVRFAVLFAVVGGLSWISVSGDAMPKVEQAPVAALPGVANSPTFRTWGQDLSPQAVDAGGIENDLDGNASALIASPLP